MEDRANVIGNGYYVSNRFIFQFSQPERDLK